MEDAYSFIVVYAGIQGQGYFAIFDGHAGKHAAEWCGQHFHEYLLQQLLDKPQQQIPETVADTFLAVDAELTKMSESGATNSGCTAVTAFLRLEDADGHQAFAPPLSELLASNLTPITSGNSKSGRSSESSSRAPTPTSSRKDKLKQLIGNFGASNNTKKGSTDNQQSKPTPAFTADGAIRRVLYTANVGDARAVLSRDGKAVRLTYDHKGNDKKEVRRIQEAGGFVLNNRVNGVLAVTRSLGDSAMKEFVVGSPYTSEMELNERDEFLIIACDGLWDVVEDQAAVELIKDCKTSQEAANALLKHALENFSHDNVTVLVVKFGADGRAQSATAKS